MLCATVTIQQLTTRKRVMGALFLFFLSVVTATFQHATETASFGNVNSGSSRCLHSPMWESSGVSRTGKENHVKPLRSKSALGGSPKLTTDCEDKSVGFYVHIPYCRRRCRYCDFAIVPIGNVDTSGRKQFESLSGEKQTQGFRLMDESYRDAVLTEIKMIRRTTGKSKLLRSIYFGGGTPSLAPVSSIKSILHAILDAPDSPFILADDAEVTIEMDPGTFDSAKLMSLKEIGFNRISLGVQSFDDGILEAIGRVHRCADVLESVNMIQAVYGDDANYSIDLISGLPGLNLAKWVETLQSAVSLSPTPSHLSLYDLQIERGTTFERWYGGDDGTIDKSSALPIPETLLSLPSADDSAFMYKYASGYLRSRGYEHYEISSYARIGTKGVAEGCQQSKNRSQHNQIYWEIGSDWYAVGLGATSSIDGKRFPRPRQMADYLSWIKGQQEKGTPSWLPEPSVDADGDEVEDTDFLCDTIMTRLRTADGLSLDWIKNAFKDGERRVSAVLQGAELALSLNMAHITEDNDGYRFLRLTDPVGFLFSNSIISSIFLELEDI